MTKSIVINKQHLSVKKYKGQNVVTFKDIDLVHGRNEGTARKRFNDNRKHFIEGVDYFVRKTDEAKKELGISAPNGLILITESGYLMLAKSFTDDLAWSVQRQLVNFYFRANQSKSASLPKSEQLTLETKEYYYFDKTYKGQPVLSVKDIEHFTGLTPSMINWYLRSHSFEAGKDYYKLEKFSLCEFKAENPNVLRILGGPYNIVTKSGFIKLMKTCGCKSEIPKCYEKVAMVTIEEKRKGEWSVYKPNEEMNLLMEEVRDKAQRIQAYSYLLTNVDLSAKSRMFRGELRCEIQRLNMMIDKIDDVRF